MLVRIAQLLRENLRADDIIARFGGEEFAVLIPGDDLGSAVLAARKIRSALRNEIFTATDGTPLRVTASFGISRGSRGEGAWPRLVQLADMALYRAKTDGRNRIRFERRNAFDGGAQTQGAPEQTGGRGAPELARANSPEAEAGTPSQPLTDSPFTASSTLE